MGCSLSPYIFHQVRHTFVRFFSHSLASVGLWSVAKPAPPVPTARTSRYTSGAFRRRLQHLRSDIRNDSRYFEVCFGGLESTGPRGTSLKGVSSARVAWRAPRTGHRPEARRVSSVRREVRQDPD
eukprot:scaffold44841_cov14-Prasinocladus_malaysianus.AAC.1